MSAARVTHRTDYAVRAMLYLCLQERGKVVPISEIAAGTGLSVKFLEEILLLLRTSGMVQSRRGKQGGYALLGEPETLTVADVVTALEGAPSAGEEASPQRDARPYDQVTRNVFQAAAEAWWHSLSSRRLSDLAEEAVRLEAEWGGGDMFHI